MMSHELVPGRGVPKSVSHRRQCLCRGRSLLHQLDPPERSRVGLELLWGVFSEDLLGSLVWQTRFCTNFLCPEGLS